MRAIALIVGVLAVALVWVGCGSSSGGDEVTASSISKAQFIKEADAACREGQKGVQNDFQAFVKENENLKNPTEAKYAELVETVLAPNIEQEVDDIRSLGAPDGDVEEIEAMLVAREEGLEEAEAQPKKAVQANLAGFTEAGKLAKGYGLKDCGTV